MRYTVNLCLAIINTYEMATRQMYCIKNNKLVKGSYEDINYMQLCLGFKYF